MTSSNRPGRQRGARGGPAEATPKDTALGEPTTLVARGSRHPTPPDATFLPGDLLADRYRIEDFLARGGMGEVYRAHDLELDTLVAGPAGFE